MTFQASTLNQLISASGVQFKVGDKAHILAVDLAAVAFMKGDTAEKRLQAADVTAELRKAYGCRVETAQGAVKYNRRPYELIKFSLAVARAHLKRLGRETVAGMPIPELLAALEAWRTAHAVASVGGYSAALFPDKAKAEAEKPAFFDTLQKALDKRGDELTEEQLRTIAEKISIRLNAIQTEREKAAMLKAQAEAKAPEKQAA